MRASNNDAQDDVELNDIPSDVDLDVVDSDAEMLDAATSAATTGEDASSSRVDAKSVPSGSTVS